jgi:hypothetical protein
MTIERAGKNWFWNLLLAAAFGTLATPPALAGQLILKNSSSQVITCTVDGWTVSSGASFDWYIQVQPDVPFYVGQNTSRPGSPIINWASCGRLTTRSMYVTPSGPNQTLVLNGQQTRVLNVELYPYLPTLPTDDFENLVSYVVQTYQSQNPQVLLNAVLNINDVNIYSFTTLPTLLGAQGFDVMELDMLYLGFLVSSGLINPAQITGEQPLSVAISGATYQGQLWGIPSWLCMDFVYSASSVLSQQATLTQLLQFLSTMPSGRPELVGDFNGSWRLPSIYINAYVQGHGGYSSIDQAMNMPPDTGTISNLVALTNTCADGTTNICTNNTVHGMPNGGAEQQFATGEASNDMGFSEQSFFINLYNGPAPLYAIATPWGQTPQPLLFEDAFVTNKSTCAPSTSCAGDASNFTDMMTSISMKNYIVQSMDLPAGTPWRTLLVANETFWNQQIVQTNPMYQQYQAVLATAQPFPNTWTATQQTSMGEEICKALKQQQAAYVCNSGQDEGGAVAPLTPSAAPPRELAPRSRRGL